MVANGSEPREILLDPMIAGSRGADGCEFDLEVDLECRLDLQFMQGKAGQFQAEESTQIRSSNRVRYVEESSGLRLL